MKLKMRLLAVLDEVVFLKRQSHKLKRVSYMNIKRQIVRDFVHITYQMFFEKDHILSCHKQGKSAPEELKALDENMKSWQEGRGRALSEVEIARKYMKVFRSYGRYGFGFTPVLARYTFRERKRGFNCLSSAIAFGSLLLISGVTDISLCQLADHFGILIEVGDKKWFCDVAGGYHVKRLYGKVKKEKNYGWYKILVRDRMWKYQYMIVRPFGDGFMNAILENVEFFKNISSWSRYRVKKYVPFHHQEYAHYWWKRARKTFVKIKVKGVREELLPDFDRPYSDHRAELLIEAAKLALLREEIELDGHFEIAIAHGISASQGIELLAAYKSRDQDPPNGLGRYPKKVMAFFEDDEPLPDYMSCYLRRHLEGMKGYLKKQPRKVWDHSMHVMREVLEEARSGGANGLAES